MKITESQLKQIVEEETEEVLQEIAPALAALGGAAARAGSAVGSAAMRGAGAIGKAVKGAAQNATKMMSKQADVNKVLQGLNRIKAPTLMQKIDKPLEVQDLLMNILGNVQVDPKMLDTVLSKVKTQVKAQAKAAAQQQQQQANPAAAKEPVGQPPAE